MKKILCSLFVAAALAAAANPVSPAKALRLARQFWNSQSAIPADKLTWTDLSSQSDYANLYLFAADTHGFVIMAADDCVTPIIGYSMENPLSAESMSPQMAAWLHDRDKEIAICVSLGLPPTDTIRLSWQQLAKSGELPKNCVSRVLPLIATKWNQTAPFNNYAPVVNDERCPIGCVAVAMAQLMKYYNYPSHGRGTHAYSYGGFSHSADFDTTYYDWSNMTNLYNGYRTEAQKEAVAKLLYHCAVSVDMQFTPNGSGAFMYPYVLTDTNTRCAANQLCKNFRYASDRVLVEQYYVSQGAWCRRLRNELDLARPILYSGKTVTDEGHMFLCDGYDYYGLFHYNWGWGGISDGYFYSSRLNPLSNPEDFTDAFVYNVCIFNLRPAERLHTSIDRISSPQEAWDTSFTVYSSYQVNVPWLLLRKPDWVTLSRSSGQGGGVLSTVTLSVEANVTGRSRSGYLTFSHGNDSVRIFVSQCACPAAEMCRLLVTVSDSARDGWEGAYLQFYSKHGYQYGTASLNDSNAVVSLPVCADSVYVAWCPGIHDSQCHYSLSNSNGYLFFEDSGAFSAPRLIENPCYEPPCATVETFPWHQDFEDRLQDHCFTRTDADGDMRNWLLGNGSYLDQGHDSRCAAVSVSYLFGVEAVTPDNWLITPAIRLSDTTPSKLSWWASAHNAYDHSEHYSVLLSTTGTAPEDFSHVLYSETLPDAQYHQRFASLADFQGETVFLAFRHHDCSNQYWISIDDIEVSYGNPPQDTDTTAIVTLDRSLRCALYPNPADGRCEVSVTTATASQPFLLELYSPAGKCLLSQMVSAESATVDVSLFPAGCYCLRITTPTATLLRRLVVLH